MEYTGAMTNILDDDGDFSFELGGKRFVACEFAPQFRALIGQTITLVVEFNPELAKAIRNEIIKYNSAAPNGMNAPIPPGQTLEEFANNADHCFIEDLRQAAPGRYVVALGS